MKTNRALIAVLAVLLLLGGYRAVQASIEAWSTSAAANNSAPPDGWPENQAPSSVNNVGREMMAQIRRLAGQAVMSNWAPAAGTGTAYAVTPSIAWASYVSGQHIKFRAPTANTGALTLNVSGLGAISVVTINGTTLTAMSSGAFATNQPVDVVYDGAHFVKVSGNYSDPLTTNGDLVVRSSGTTTRLALGSENTFLTVSNSAVAWKSLTQHLDRIIAASPGALLYRDTSTWKGLAAGVSGQFLRTQGNTAAPVYATPSTLLAGSTLTLNPYAVSTTATIAHGLGAEPTFYKVVFENLTTEGGWSVGDRILVSSSVYSTANGLIGLAGTTTEARMSTSNNLPVLTPKQGGAGFTMTAASWKAILIPYLLQ